MRMVDVRRFKRFSVHIVCSLNQVVFECVAWSCCWCRCGLAKNVAVIGVGSRYNHADRGICSWTSFVRAFTVGHSCAQNSWMEQLLYSLNIWLPAVLLTRSVGEMYGVTFSLTHIHEMVLWHPPYSKVTFLMHFFLSSSVIVVHLSKRIVLCNRWAYRIWTSRLGFWHSDRMNGCAAFFCSSRSYARKNRDAPNLAARR